MSFIRRSLFTGFLLPLFFCSLFCLPANAQQSVCLSPISLPATTEPVIFTEEQEVYLGDAVAEQIQKDYRIIEDVELTSYLTRLGEQLNKHLPLTKMRFQFFLVDLPNANAFALPGGRIYVSRKLVALAQSEDELAGVVAHELGHLVAREHSIDLTRRLREVLGVTQVTDRRDILEKYNQLIDNINRKPAAFKPRDREKGQLIADQVGFYALVSAGYDPGTQARFWDRATETKGKKGNFFTDLFGSTRPEERRLREMLKALSSLPASCRRSSSSAQNELFKQWQLSVISYTGLGRAESLHGVLWKRQLTPPLRSDITHLRFSPDGKYVLAQDDAGINVLTREPFETVFRIESPDAKPAHFTPDSQSIILYTDNLRVEKWNVAEAKMTEANEVVVLNGCLQTKLSPDGKFLVCLTPKFDLNVLDVASGQLVIQKKEFYSPDYYQYLGLIILLIHRGDESSDLGANLIQMGFSADAKYFIAGFWGSVGSISNRRDSVVVAFDMTSLSKVSLPDSIKKYITSSFTFIGSDRIAGVNHEDYRKSALVAFPSGQVISEFPLSPRRLIAPTRSDHLMLRPVKEYALGVMDTSNGTIFKVNQQPALDIYDDVFVAELRNGQVGLYRMEKNALLGAAQLSNVTLGRLYAAEVSPNMKFLALSGRSRGGVWDLTKGEATHYLRGFRGVHLTSDGYLFADFPKYEEAERNVARISLTSGEIAPGQKIEAQNAHQIGPYLAVLKSAKQNSKPEVMEWGKIPEFGSNVVLEMLDAPTMRLLWSKTYPREAPRAWTAPTFKTTVLVWNVKDETAKIAIKGDPRLSQQLGAMREKEGDYYLQIHDSRSGDELGRLLIETGKGSFRLSNVFAAGDWVIVTDTQNRVLVYSLKTGVLNGRAFGAYATVSEATGLLGVENEKGKLAVYDLSTMNKRDDFTFSSPIAMLRFSPDGQRLFVLTANQIAYELDVSEPAKTVQRM